MHDHVEALKYLINKRNANLSISNKDSKLPIHYAAKHGSKNVLSFFFRSILTIYATDQHGNTIAHEASESNQLECMKLIWKLNRTLLTKKNHLGRTPNHTVRIERSLSLLYLSSSRQPCMAPVKLFIGYLNSTSWKWMNMIVSESTS